MPIFNPPSPPRWFQVILQILDRLRSFRPYLPNAVFEDQMDLADLPTLSETFGVGDNLDIGGFTHMLGSSFLGTESPSSPALESGSSLSRKSVSEKKLLPDPSRRETHQSIKKQAFAQHASRAASSPAALDFCGRDSVEVAICCMHGDVSG